MSCSSNAPRMVLIRSTGRVRRGHALWLSVVPGEPFRLSRIDLQAQEPIVPGRLWFFPLANHRHNVLDDLIVTDVRLDGAPHTLTDTTTVHGGSTIRIGLRHTGPAQAPPVLVVGGRGRTRTRVVCATAPVRVTVALWGMMMAPRPPVFDGHGPGLVVV